MTHYAGLDVSLKETAICVVDKAGSVVWEGKVGTTIETIASALTRHAPKLEREAWRQAQLRYGSLTACAMRGCRSTAFMLDVQLPR